MIITVYFVSWSCIMTKVKYSLLKTIKFLTSFRFESRSILSHLSPMRFI